MSCELCGSQCVGRYCKECGQDYHRDETPVSTVASAPNVNLFECTVCGTEYETDGSDACPGCGARSRRYAGPLGASA